MIYVVTGCHGGFYCSWRRSSAEKVARSWEHLYLARFIRVNLFTCKAKDVEING